MSRLGPLLGITDEDDLQRRLAAMYPTSSLISKSGKKTTLWIHRAYAKDLMVYFNTLEMAYEFGINFIKAHTIYRKDMWCKYDSIYPGMYQWTDNQGIEWVADFKIEKSLEDVISSNKYDEMIAASSSLQLIVYENHQAPPEHNTMYPDGIFLVKPESANKYGLTDCPLYYESISPIVLREIIPSSA